MSICYYIDADLGTSGLKLLLVDAEDSILNSVTKSYEVSYPNPGWSEQNPEDWWMTFIDGMGELLAGFEAKNVTGIAVAGQMHGLVILDEKDTNPQNFRRVFKSGVGQTPSEYRKKHK